MSTPAARQRQALAEALTKAGPEAPTLCEGWLSIDLATHILVRERRPDAMVASHISFLNRHTQSVERQYQRTGYAAMVQKVAEGLGKFSPLSLSGVDNLMNTVEFFVHTEDVLRAREGFDPQQVRKLHNDDVEAIWKQGTQLLFAMTARKAKKRIIFESPGRYTIEVGPKNAPLQRVTGEPGELMLWAFGRDSVAQVTLSTS